MRHPHIALSGKAGSGKTTVAGVLCDILKATGRPVFRLAFADALKREVYEMYGLRKTDPGGREKLLEHGAARRRDDLHYWVKQTMSQVAELDAAGSLVVIDDCRMVHEFEAVSAAGFRTVRVAAPDSIRRWRLEADGNDASIVTSDTPTETALDDAAFDLRISNAGLWTPYQVALNVASFAAVA